MNSALLEQRKLHLNDILSSDRDHQLSAMNTDAKLTTHQGLQMTHDTTKNDVAHEA